MCLQLKNKKEYEVMITPNYQQFELLADLILQNEENLNFFEKI